ncbi:MAG: hypothetical protein AAFQ82_04580, partial [Myxococcota bacterium]
SECSCGATRSCRHRVATILAYQALQVENSDATSSSPEADAASSDRNSSVNAKLKPVDVTDEMLRERLSKATFRSALRARDQGYAATVRFADPPVVLLPTCTVTFLVPWELAHARCDCVSGGDCEHVAMAIWAVRHCSESSGEQLVSIGGEPGQAQEDSVVREFHALANELVSGGWTGALEGIETRSAPLRAALDKGRRVWLVDLLDALLAAVGESDDGSAGADALECSRLLAEVSMRCNARPNPKTPAGHLYGEGVSGTTKLDHVVLRAIGARYRVTGRTGRLSVFFRERGSTDALVLERNWTVDDGQVPPPGPEIAKRRLVGTPLSLLATSNITTRGAARRPNRVLDVSSNRLQTSVLRGSGQRLETIDDYSELRDRMSQRAPATLGPRIRAWSVVVIAMGEVESMGYDPGTRTVWGVIADSHGHTLTLVSEWYPEAPAAPALLARALCEGGVSYICAEASLRQGRLWLEPLTIGFDAPVAVDLHPECEIPPLPVAAVPLTRDPLVSVLRDVEEWLGGVARRGVSHLGPAQRRQAQTLVARLQEVGFEELARDIKKTLEEDQAVQGWNDLASRAYLTSYLLARGDGV